MPPSGALVRAPSPCWFVKRFMIYSYHRAGLPRTNFPSQMSTAPRIERQTSLKKKRIQHNHPGVGVALVLLPCRPPCNPSSICWIQVKLLRFHKSPALWARQDVRAASWAGEVRLCAPPGAGDPGDRWQRRPGKCFLGSPEPYRDDKVGLSTAGKSGKDLRAVTKLTT